MAGLVPAPAPVAAAGNGYWHTDGSRIVDDAGNQVKIAGVNWFGLETGTFAPHGLWSRGYKDMMDQMKNLGYNAIRLPYSNEALAGGAKPNGIDYSKNPDLANLSPVEIMDRIVAYAGQIGMKVILDQHRPDSQAQSSLWYTGSLSESRWIDDWKMLASRYNNNATVIGADLHNEPHDNACWGCGDAATDWKEAATRAGNAILSANPNWLIIVEGVQAYNNQYYWWGGNLQGVKANPVTLSVAHRLVYSTHDYPASVTSQPWLNDAAFPGNLAAVWDTNWGYIAKQNIAPVLVGEFGSKLETDKDKQWFDSIVSYIKNNNLSWTFWSWNPDSGDTNGLLLDDWATVNSQKQQALSTIQGSTFAPSPAGAATTPAPSAAATPAPAAAAPAASAAPSNVTYTVTNQWNNGFLANVTLTNQGGQPLTGWNIQFSFPDGQKLVQSWSASMNQNGNTVTVSPVDWNRSIPAYGSTTFGFQGSYSGANSAPAVFAVTGSGITSLIPTVTPSPAPTATATTPAAAPVSGKLTVWWPTLGSSISGTQPFKAVLEGSDISSYSMYWQVDNGQMNQMGNSTQDAPHKESQVDVSGWNWKGAGPYAVKFTAKNPAGQVLGEAQVSVTVQH